MLPIFVLLSCSKETQRADTALQTCGVAQEHVAVVVSMDFARRDDNNAAKGFDLDNHSTEVGDSKGCGIGDISSPDGRSGIDNAWPSEGLAASRT